MRLTEHQSRHRDDIERIMCLVQRRGLVMGFFDAYELWSQHSENYSAGWLILPDDDEVLWATIQGSLLDLLAPAK